MAEKANGIFPENLFADRSLYGSTRFIVSEKPNRIKGYSNNNLQQEVQNTYI